MKRVTGIGGMFFHARDAPALHAWYTRHLGIDVQTSGGTAFTWTDGDDNPFTGTTMWSIGADTSVQFAWGMDPDGNTVELWQPPTEP